MMDKMTHEFLAAMALNLCVARGMLDDQHVGGGDDASGEGSPGVGAVTIWYQVAEGGLYSRVEMARLDDAQAVWDLLAARGRLMRSPRP